MNANNGLGIVTDTKYLLLAVAALAVVSAVAVSAVFFDGSDDSEAGPVIVADTEVIDTKVGEEFTVSLNGNVTTGFDWVVKDSCGLELKKDWYAQNDAGDPPRCGVGGVHHFVFVAEKPGTYELKFDYQRSWEGSEGNLTIVKVTVS